MDLRQEVLIIAERIVRDNNQQLEMRTLDFFSHLNEMVITDTEKILEETYYDSFSDEEREAIKFNVIFNVFMDILASSNLKIVAWHHQFMEEVHEEHAEHGTEFDVSLGECVEMFGQMVINKLKNNTAEERAAIESLGLN